MKRLVGIIRGLLALPFLLLTVLALGLLALATCWWYMVGYATIPLGRTARWHVSRWLGAYPFQILLVHLAAHAALMIWVLRGKPWVMTFGKFCRGALDKLEDTEELRAMGGFW